ncbi:MAG: hypothetical protein H0U81_07390 [Pyrinomonadaceae bacterium]|nr:hypothetical protein [Pyrinomonadaceae bacterium]
MKLTHPNITSAVFELVRVLELDITLGDDFIPTRIELFRDTERDDYFRCHVWELEHFRLTPTFPQDGSGGPAHISDDVIMVERGTTYRIRGFGGSFTASSADAALEMVIAELNDFLKHVTGEELKKE